MTGTGWPLFPWPAQLLNSTNGPDCSVSNNALRHTFLHTLIQSNWDSLEGGVSEVNVCRVFWPLEDSSQMSYSLVLSCKLTAYSWGCIFITSKNLLPIAFYYNLRCSWETPLDVNLSTPLGMKSGSVEEIWCYTFLLLPPEAKYLSQGSGAGGGDSGELFCEWSFHSMNEPWPGCGWGCCLHSSYLSWCGITPSWSGWKGYWGPSILSGPCLR